MPAGVRSLDTLDELVADYSEFEEFCVDVETKGPHRDDPRRNDVFWISLAGPGRADAIPCGHPLGERIVRDPDDDFYRINPSTGKHEEHRVNESTGRLKWVQVDGMLRRRISGVFRNIRPTATSSIFSGDSVRRHPEALAEVGGRRCVASRAAEPP